MQGGEYAFNVSVKSTHSASHMRNDLLRVGFGNFLPIRKRTTIMAIDWVVIGACYITYIIHFFTATM